MKQFRTKMELLFFVHSLKRAHCRSSFPPSIDIYWRDDGECVKMCAM